MALPPYLTATQVRGRSHRLADYSDAEIGLAVLSFEEVVLSYWGKDYRPLDEDGVFDPTVDLPENLLAGCAEYCSALLTSRSSGTSRDVIAMTAEGSWTRFSTPDRTKGRPTGWTEPDRLINSLEPRIPGIA